jgi:alpha-galactosidase
MYREDNNCNAVKLWAHLDRLEGENRQGITESKFIIGHYKMWDDIIACTLSMGGCGFVDSCASGGGRNDLESLRRGVPLLRSDSDRCAISHRLSMTTAFSKWIPFNGAGGIEDNQTRDAFALAKADLYSARASYFAALNINKLLPTQDPDTDFDFYRKVMAEWKRVSPYLLKEFYVLTPWHREIDRTRHGGVDTVDYTVYCYFDPEKEKGVLFGFREEECAKDTFLLRLPFANGEKYLLRDEDSGEETVYDGETELYFASKRTARMIWVEKL